MHWRRILLFGLAFAIFLFVLSGFLLPLDGTPEGQWGPFRGQVVDAETGKPIPGAVFVAIWLRTIPTPVHAGQVFNDARAAVTDADGRFNIPRRWRPMFSGLIDPVRLVCVAPGYTPYGGGSTNQPPILRLHTFASEGERHLRQNGYSSDLGLIPHTKRTKIEGTVNEERSRMGLQAIGFASGVL